MKRLIRAACGPVTSAASGPGQVVTDFRIDSKRRVSRVLVGRVID